VKVKPSTCRIYILKAVIGEPPVLGKLQVILTLLPSIVVYTLVGILGAYAARIETMFEGTL
jgi:hypothetical protein